MEEQEQIPQLEDQPPQLPDSEIEPKQMAADNTVQFPPKLGLEVKVISVKHLPKMDTFGKCDPFLTITFGGLEYKTEVIKKTYDADFDEAFEFGCNDVSELVFIVWDWNQMGSAEQVGEVRIPFSRMSSILQEDVGWTVREEQQVIKKGKIVNGHDKQPCIVTFGIRLLDRRKMAMGREASKKMMMSMSMSSRSIRDLAAAAGEMCEVDTDSDAKGKRQLEVTLVKARSLPKMDVGFFGGTCDPYCKLQFCGQVFETTVKKGTYSPDWAETFSFLVDVDSIEDQMLVECFDWDIAGGNDLIGEVPISRERLSEIVRAKVGWEGGDTYVIQNREDGKRVVGNDKQTSMLSVHYRVLEAPKHFAELVVNDAATGSRQIELTVKSARLPEKRGLLGSTSCHSSLLYEGVEYKTATLKSRTPEFEQAFLLKVADVQQGCARDVIFRVTDHNLTNVEEAGEAVLSRERMNEIVKAEIGWEGVDALPLFRAGKPLLDGNNQCEITIKIRILEESQAFPDIVPKQDSVGARRLEVTVLQARHLPKMDELLGSCDPYIKMLVEGIEYKTKVLKGTLSPDWDETFIVDVPEASAGFKNDFRFVCMDWNATSSDDECGYFVLSAKRMSDVVKAEIDSEAEDKFMLVLDGRPVVGHDKQPSEVLLKIKVLAELKCFPEISPEQDAEGARLLQVTVRSVEHLPKMDGLLGSCDPYVVMVFRGLEYKTKVVKGAYDADFEQTFAVTLEDAAEGFEEDVIFTVMDWNRTGKDDECGRCAIPASRMAELVKAKIGTQDEHTFPLTIEGRPLEGHDKQPSVLTVKIVILDELKVFSHVEPVEGARGGRCLHWKIINARHLPKMDVLGSCDPYIVMRYAGVEYKTTVLKGTYNPEFGVTFYVDVVDVAEGCAEDVSFTVLDWDRASEHDVCGKFTIRAGRVSELMTAKIGTTDEGTFDLFMDGRPVLGHDKQQSHVTIQFSVNAERCAFPDIKPEADAKGGRRLELTILKAKNLPNMDGILGSADPYVVMLCEGIEYRTKVVKGSLDPTFDDTFTVNIPDVSETFEHNVFFTVMDWDRVGEHDECGIFEISAARMSALSRAKIGSQGEDSFLLTRDGAPVFGKGMQQSEVTVRLAVLEELVAFPEIMPEPEATGSRRVELTVVRARHLPKMDALLGSCDGYVVLNFEGVEYETEVVKGTYNPDFNHTFRLRIPDASRGVNQVVHFCCKDWDRVSAHDECGSFSIGVARMSELVKAAIGTEGEHTFLLQKEGRPIVGHDKQQSEVAIHFKVLEEPKAFPELLPESNATGARRIEIKVLQARHLPKMDGLMGSCDPYVVMIHEGEKFKTEVVKSSYDPDFNSVFALDIADVVSGSKQDVVFSVMDWDRATKHDKCGQFIIPAGRMSEILKAQIGSQSQDTFALWLSDKPVIGNDKQQSEVTVQIQILEEVKAFPDLVPSGTATGACQLEFSVISARHLPRMDTLGSCDPYFQLQYQQLQFETEVRKGTYSPDWSDGVGIRVPIEDVSKECRQGLVGKAYDWDMASAHDLIGWFVVPARRLTELSRVKIGSSSTHKFELFHDGAHVIGNDKEKAVVTVRVQVLEELRAFPDLVPDNAASGTRRLEIIVLGCQHLPKMDMLMGSCDPYVRLDVGELRFETEIKKGTYSPEWTDDLGLRVQVEDASKDFRHKLILEVYDWDRASAHDLIGTFEVSARRMTELSRVRVGSTSTDTFEILNNGAPVLGKDKKKAVVTVKIQVLEMTKAFSDLLPDENASGACRLEFSVKSARHLPKMDVMLGKCDPYVKLKCDRLQFETEVMKGTYSPDWTGGGVLRVPIDDVGTSFKHGLVGETFDWDRTTAHDLIGSFLVPASRLTELSRVKIGSTSTDTFELYNRGAPVIGNDKEKAVVTVTIHVLEELLAFPDLQQCSDCAGTCRLEFKVLSARNLPKMDLVGSVDPYVRLRCDRLQFETEVMKGTYSPDWTDQHDGLRVQIEDVSKTFHHDVFGEVYDWDRATAHDLIGSFVVPARRMTQLCKVRIGSTSTYTFELFNDGKPVEGKNKERAVVLVELQVLEEIKAFPDLVPEENASGACRLEFSVVSARHLPKMDIFLGSCDPYFKISWDRLSFKTVVIKDSYSPDWTDGLGLKVPVEDVSKPCQNALVVEGYDWDRATAHDLIGSCVVPARRMTELSRAKIGSTSTDTFELFLGGGVVVGKDGEKAVVTVKVQVLEELRAFPDLDPLHDRSGACRLNFAVISARHLPKMDVMLGTVDPYVRLLYNRLQFETEVRKGTYSPDWNDEKGFNIHVEDVNQPCKYGLVGEMYDWDRTTAHDRIGSFLVSARRMTELSRVRIGLTSTDTFELLNDGAPVIGKDNEKAVVTVQLKVLEEFRAFPELVPDCSSTGGACQLEFTILSGRHLPKMDILMGNIDPYVRLRYGRAKFETEVLKSTYSPDWDDGIGFRVLVDDNTKSSHHELVGEVYDWDRATAHDLIGKFVIPSRRMTELSRVRIGSTSTDTFELFNDGAPVFGKDKEKAVISVRLQVLEEKPAFPDLVPDENASGACRLEFSVVSARHLPKMDILLGSCDPFCKVAYGHMQFETEVIKGTYDPEWTSVGFPIAVDDVTRGCRHGLVGDIYDWDRATAHDLIGSFTVPERRMKELSRVKIGSTSTDTFELFLDGGFVVGKDREKASVTVKVQVLEELRAFPDLLPSDDANGACQLEFSVIDAHHLPKMDVLMGSVDPYVRLNYDRLQFETEVMKATYSPRWNSVGFCVPIEDVTRPRKHGLVGQAYDWDRATAHDLIGTFVVPARRMTELSRVKIGSTSTDTFDLFDGEVPVVGKDKKKAQVTVKLTVLEGLRAFPDLIPSDDVSGACRLEFSILSARHLPKMDLLLSSCDPYCRISFDCRKFETEVVKGSYSPEWNSEGFCVPIDEVNQPCPHALVIEMYDWDRASAHDLIGMFMVPARRMAELSRVKIGSKSTDTFGLFNDGAPVIGNDKQKASVTMQLRVLDELRAWPDLVSLSDTSLIRSCRLEFCVLSARHLPKSDVLLGKCNPYVKLLYRGGLPFETEVAESTYSPDWNPDDCFDVEIKDVSKDTPHLLVGELYDWDRFTVHNLLGSFTVLPRRMTELSRVAGGSESTHTFGLLKDGVPVIGHDKNKAEVQVRVRIFQENVKVLCIHGEEPETCEKCRLAREALFAEAWLVAGKRPPRSRTSDRLLKPVLLIEAEPQIARHLGSVRAVSSQIMSVQSTMRGPNMLDYVDTPVWRGGNGEVLVGRDVIPFIGMRVLMARQTRRHLYETGKPDPSAGGPGVVVKLLAGNQTVHPSSLTRDGNGAFCKVLWDVDKKSSRQRAGAGGMFELVPLKSGLEYREPNIREDVVLAALGNSLT